MRLCGKHLYAGTMSPGVCFRCDQYDGPSRGLGDTVAKVTKVFGVKECGGCAKRRARLNQMKPYQETGNG